jgi:DNA-binding CsgD family transcriptional regulator/tetratricopeptide (TPR) repeat protein
MPGSLDGVVVGRSGLSPTMVGRRSELERLLKLVPQVDDPRVALVGGEPGVGKTRLIREFRSRLPDAIPLLTGQATREAVGRPFELLLEAVEPEVSQWEALPTELESRADAVRILLGPLAPQLGRAGREEFYQQELVRAAVEVVRAIVAGRPTVVVFEDLHWADTESVKVFGRIGTSPGLPILALGTYRPEDLTRRHAMAELLDQLERDQTLAHLTLQRLSSGEVAELLAGVYRRPIPVRVAEALHRRTGGNPFFLEELVVGAGKVPPEELPTVPLPWNLSEAVLRHVDALGPDELAVVEAAAVAGQRFSFDLLQVMTEQDELELIEVLRRLVTAGLLVEDAPDVFTFRHALTHEAVVGSLLGRQRRRLHEAALTALWAAESNDYAALAHHAEGAGRLNDLIEVARGGGTHYLKTGATHEALRLAERGLGEAGDDVELLATAAVAAWKADLLADARSYGERWEAETAATGQPEARSRALRFLARLEFDSGRPRRQLPLLEEARAMAEPLGETEELAWVYAQIAEAHMLTDEPDEALAWADQALELAARVGVPGPKVRALVNKGSVAVKHDVERGSELLDEAVALAEEIGDHLSVVRALNNAIDSCWKLWPREQTVAAIERMRETAERAGLDHFVKRAVQFQADDAEYEGQLDRALSIISGLDWDRQVGEHTWSVIHEAILRCHRGDLDAADALLEALGEVEDPDERSSLIVARAYVAALRGDADRVRSLMAGFAEDRGATSPKGRRGLTVLALRAGVRPQDVRSFLNSLPDLDPASVSYDPTSAAAAEAALLAAEGDHEAAVAHLEMALAPDGRRRPAARIAWFRIDLARSLLALGRANEAVPHAVEAGRLLERWPGWLADEAQALLRRLGVGPVREGPEALTAREREVAALLAEGLSNAELADRLFISVRTAAVHVSHILNKLGMSSRAEVAAWAVRNGLGPEQHDVRATG